MVAKNAEEHRTDTERDNATSGDELTRGLFDVARQLKTAFAKQGLALSAPREAMTSVPDMTKYIEALTNHNVAPNTLGAIVLFSNPSSSEQPVAREYLVSSSPTAEHARTPNPPRTSKNLDALHQQLDDVLTELQDSEIAQMTEAITASSEDDLDERLWGPAPSRAATASATLNDLRRQHAARRALADSGITRKDAADLLGISPQAVTERLDTRQLVGVKTGREWRIPTWQFDLDSATGVLPALDRLQQVFPGGPVSLSKWVHRPSPDLDGLAPRDALARDDSDRVCALADALTAAGW